MKQSTEQTNYRSLKWLDTGGGPYVLVATKDLSKWGGIRTDEAPSDFDRACEVEDYIGAVPLGEGQAIVLGDDPFATAFMSAPMLGGGYILRWLWGDDEQAAVAALHRIRPEDWTSEKFAFDAGDGRLTLFDSIHPGDAAPHRIEVELGPGRYAVATANVQPNENLCLMVHRLIPLQ